MKNFCSALHQHNIYKKDAYIERICYKQYNTAARKNEKRLWKHYDIGPICKTYFIFANESFNNYLKPLFFKIIRETTKIKKLLKLKTGFKLKRNFFDNSEKNVETNRGNTIHYEEGSIDRTPVPVPASTLARRGVIIQGSNLSKILNYGIQNSTPVTFQSSTLNPNSKIKIKDDAKVITNYNEVEVPKQVYARFTKIEPFSRNLKMNSNEKRDAIWNSKLFERAKLSANDGISVLPLYRNLTTSSSLCSTLSLTKDSSENLIDKTTTNNESMIWYSSNKATSPSCLQPSFSSFNVRKLIFKSIFEDPKKWGSIEMKKETSFDDSSLIDNTVEYTKNKLKIQKYTKEKSSVCEQEQISQIKQLIEKAKEMNKIYSKTTILPASKTISDLPVVQDKEQNISLIKMLEKAGDLKKEENIENKSATNIIGNLLSRSVEKLINKPLENSENKKNVLPSMQPLHKKLLAHLNKNKESINVKTAAAFSTTTKNIAEKSKTKNEFNYNTSPVILNKESNKNQEVQQINKISTQSNTVAPTDNKMSSVPAVRTNTANERSKRMSTNPSSSRHQLAPIENMTKTKLSGKKVEPVMSNDPTSHKKISTFKTSPKLSDNSPKETDKKETKSMSTHVAKKKPILNKITAEKRNTLCPSFSQAIRPIFKVKERNKFKTKSDFIAHMSTGKSCGYVKNKKNEYWEKREKKHIVCDGCASVQKIEDEMCDPPPKKPVGCKSRISSACPGPRKKLPIDYKEILNPYQRCRATVKYMCDQPKRNRISDMFSNKKRKYHTVSTSDNCPILNKRLKKEPSSKNYYHNQTLSLEPDNIVWAQKQTNQKPKKVAKVAKKFGCGNPPGYGRCSLVKKEAPQESSFFCKIAKVFNIGCGSAKKGCKGKCDGL